MRQKSSTSFDYVTFTRAKYRILYHFSFPKTLFSSFLHHHCLQFPYPTNFLVRKCFPLLVSSIFKYIVNDICEYWQVLTSYSYDVASLIEDRALMQFPPPPPPPPPPPQLQLLVKARQTPAYVKDQHCTEALTRRPFRF